MPSEGEPLRFIADMGVARGVTQWLRSQGNDVTHLSEERLTHMVDSEVFAKAAAERRVILTFDLDFGEILAFSQGRSVSVVIFRLHNTRTAHVIERLQSVLRAPNHSQQLPGRAPVFKGGGSQAPSSASASWPTEK